MSAVRMVAYGVLEMKHKDPTSPLFIKEEWDLQKEKAEDYQRDRLRKVVNDELKRYGLIIIRRVVPQGQRWRTKANEHTLYGQVIGPNNLFLSRPVLCEGTFKECCIVAAELLDALDASQTPDTAAGPDQR